MKYFQHGFAMLLATGLVAGVAWGRPHPRDVASRAPASVNADLQLARAALFVRSDLAAAREHLESALRLEPINADALFLATETAALEARTTDQLDLAVRLCELRTGDPRADLAAARVLDLAGNTAEFRAVLPRLRALIAAGVPQENYLRAALLAAASDGVPGLDPLAVARDSGLITDWRIAGPFGHYNNVDFDRAWPPEQDLLTRGAYGDVVSERFRFVNGNVRLAEYFARGGVFYAAAEVSVPSTGDYWLRAESEGTLEAAVDGATALRKDSRFREAPEVTAAAVHLSAGAHHVLVKFISSAVPFRIALFPERRRSVLAAAPVESTPEARYIAAEERFWAGDYAGVVAALKSDPSAIARLLTARAWSHVAGSASEEDSALEAALRAAPGALAAEQQLAGNEYADDHLDDALAHVRQILAARPDLASAQELMFEIASQWNWRTEAAQALDARLRLHPDCGMLRDALKFYSNNSDFARAASAESRLQDCAPGSLAYADALSDAGRHADAAAEARRVSAQHPLDREARALLVRELRLAGDDAGALAAAQDLTRLAPNSTRFADVARQAAAPQSGAISENDGARAADFDPAKAFYRPYRRDGLQILKATADRRFSGGPAVTLLSDRVARLASDGSVSLYVHKVTRVLDKDGIEQYGEVALPQHAEVLELRTLKADGSVAEPELTENKTTISMPALAPGDAIEQEYLVHYPDGGLAAHTDAFRFDFGSFDAPILFARFVAITPFTEETWVRVAATVNGGERRQGHGETIRTWEQQDIAQSVEEVAMPRSGVLPGVRLLPAYGDWREVADFYRDMTIEVARIGTRVQELAAQAGAGAPEERARRLYHLVASRVRPGDGSFRDDNPLSAEESLAARQGSRTATLLAVASAAGLRADLVLARDIADPASGPALHAYTRPLVRFRFPAASGERDVICDAETDSIGFGELPPTLATTDALFVPVHAVEPAREPAITGLPGPQSQEDSVADAELRLDVNGDLSAQVAIHMVGWRGAQMRSILRGIARPDRQHFFEQLATRIFAGAVDVSGTIENESDPDRPLLLRFTCRAPRFISFAGSTADLDQIVPALGLRKMYVGLSGRTFPLYLDTPFFERATFRLHLAPGLRLIRLAPDFAVQNEFGSYSVAFRELANGDIEIRRAFDIPVQVVPAARFAAFAHLAERIDDAERQRLLLARDVLSASRGR